MRNGEQAPKRHVLLAGGGTGGHVFPGLAVAEELDRRGCRVSWLGRPVGMERELVEAKGLDYHALEAHAVLGRGAMARIGALATTAVSAIRARGVLRRQGVDAVLGTGGYVSAPAVLGARLARRSVFLLEPNSRAGAANRWLSRFADGVCVGYAETATQVKGRSVHTGIPVRAEFFTGAGLPDGPPRLLVLGGSQGARQINQLLPAALRRLSEGLRHETAGAAGRLTVLHQAGADHVDSVKADYSARERGGVEVRVTSFVDDVAAEMAASHLVISRAGALTLAELCAAARPAILVPLTIAAGHQRDNAERLRAAGAAELFDTGGADELAEILRSLFGDRERLLRMSAAAGSLARPDAASRIADLLQGGEEW